MLWYTAIRSFFQLRPFNKFLNDGAGFELYDSLNLHCYEFKQCIVNQATGRFASKGTAAEPKCPCSCSQIFEDIPVHQTFMLKMA